MLYDRSSLNTGLFKLCIAIIDNKAGLKLGLRLLCSKFYLLFLPALPKKFTHYSYFMLSSLPIILIKFFWLYCMQVLLELSVAGAAVKRVLWGAALLLTVLLEYIDLFGRIQPTAPPSATRALNHSHQVWQYSKHHAQKGPKILKLCLWASYNSGIIPSKMWTYNSLNYAGILGASLFPAT